MRRFCKSLLAMACLTGSVTQPQTGIPVPALLFMGGSSSASAQQPPAAPSVTAAQLFDDMVKRMQKQREEEPWNPRRFALDPYLMLDMQMEDWTGTPEGKFAHSIKIPNPVPEDSGYKPGMTQQEYFEHLCKNEAGEFIFKTADNVESIFQMRPRPFYRGSDGAHLYAIEDPYGYHAPEVEDPAFSFIEPRFLYSELEIPIAGRRIYGVALRGLRHPSMSEAPLQGSFISRFFLDKEIQPDSLQMQMRYASAHQSRYGFTWRGIKRPHDREMGIGGGELIVLDLLTNEVMGVRRGYAVWNRGWTGRLCPRYGYGGGQDKTTFFSSWFVAKVARPSSWKEFFANREQFRVVPK